MTKKYRSVYIDGERYIEEITPIWKIALDWVIVVVLFVVIFYVYWRFGL